MEEVDESFVHELIKALNAQSQILVLLMVILVFLIIALIVSQIIQLFSSNKILKVQAQQFNQTLEVIKTIAYALPPDRDPLVINMPGLLPTDNLTVQNDLADLADQCVRIGEEIDRHTDRRNNSKLVSELVYKISCQLDLDKETCALYFCAAMVYDIGFLDAPQEYFRAEILNTSEKRILRAHILHGKRNLNFVKEKYRKTFIDACTYHHENLDGTGYPEGRKGDEIPLISKIIHVVESYISLINPRNYHKILDKQSAIEELYRQKGIYDADIIKALSNII